MLCSHGSSQIDIHSDKEYTLTIIAVEDRIGTYLYWLYLAAASQHVHCSESRMTQQFTETWMRHDAVTKLELGFEVSIGKR